MFRESKINLLSWSVLYYFFIISVITIVEEETVTEETVIGVHLLLIIVSIDVEGVMIDLVHVHHLPVSIDSYKFVFRKIDIFKLNLYRYFTRLFHIDFVVKLIINYIS